MLAILVTLGAGQAVVRGQQTATNSALVLLTNTATAGSAPRLTLRDPAVLGLQLREPDTNALEYTLSRTKVRLSGPAVRPMKAKNVSDFSRRVLHLFSPFSDEKPNLPPGAEVSGPVSTRAWTTVVGWSPGQSAFPDESHHEPPQLRLLSVGLEKQPKQP